MTIEGAAYRESLEVLKDNIKSTGEIRSDNLSDVGLLFHVHAEVVIVEKLCLDD